MHHYEALGLMHFQLSKTMQISNEVLSLPMYPELSEEKAKFVIGAVRDFYRG
jgi:dTDP-4-amino-4,6-dideoxygalactose transaminase